MNWLKSNIMTVRNVKIKLLLGILIFGVYKVGYAQNKEQPNILMMCTF